MHALLEIQKTEPKVHRMSEKRPQQHGTLYKFSGAAIAFFLFVAIYYFFGPAFACIGAGIWAIAFGLGEKVELEATGVRIYGGLGAVLLLLGAAYLLSLF